MDHPSRVIHEMDRMQRRLKFSIADLFDKHAKVQVCQFHHELNNKSKLYGVHEQAHILGISTNVINKRIEKNKDYKIRNS